MRPAASAAWYEATCIFAHAGSALSDIADVKPCMDPSLPAGHAFWVSLQSRPTGLYFCAGMPHAAPDGPMQTMISGERPDQAAALAGRRK